MVIAKFETWWIDRGKCLFDEKRKGKSSMDWDVVVLKLTTDNGIEGIATALAARSGRVTETYLKPFGNELVDKANRQLIASVRKCKWKNETEYRAGL